jgi:hypothetical protein
MKAGGENRIKITCIQRALYEICRPTTVREGKHSKIHIISGIDDSGSFHVNIIQIVSMAV